MYKLMEYFLKQIYCLISTLPRIYCYILINIKKIYMFNFIIKKYLCININTIQTRN